MNKERMVLKARVFWLRVQWKFLHFQEWITKHIPANCQVCGASIYGKNGHVVRTLWGNDMLICDDCYQAAYKPFRQR